MTTGQAVGAVSREAAEWYALKRAVRTVVHVGRRQSPSRSVGVLNAPRRIRMGTIE
jgi:hypothetical protein